MMDLKINNGSLTITDDNKTIASKNVYKDIEDKCLPPDSILADESAIKNNKSYTPKVSIKD